MEGKGGLCEGERRKQYDGQWYGYEIEPALKWIADSGDETISFPESRGSTVSGLVAG